MKTSSCKAKGRLLQQLGAAALRALGKPFGLEDDDIKSTSMGANGVDIQYSPAARRLFGDHAWEAKNVENLNVVGVFWEHAKKYPGKLWVLLHKRNRTEPLVTITLTYFIQLLGKELNANGSGS